MMKSTPLVPTLSPFVQIFSTTVLTVSKSLYDLNRFQFSPKIAEKLDEKNFHLWRQQIESYFNAHNLMEFVVCSCIPPQFADDDAHTFGAVNPDYTRLLQKDQMAFSWL